MLRPLITRLATHYGGGYGASENGISSASASYSRSANRTVRSNSAIPMKSLLSSRNRDTAHDLVNGAGGKNGGYSYGIQAQSQRPQHPEVRSMDSSSSRELIIRKDISWYVGRG